MQEAAGSMSSSLPGSKYLGQSKQAQPRYFSANRGGGTSPLSAALRRGVGSEGVVGFRRRTSGGGCEAPSKAGAGRLPRLAERDREQA
jgi:hypothetical protein